MKSDFFLDNVEFIFGDLSVKSGEVDSDKYLLVGFNESSSDEKVLKYIDGGSIKVFNFFFVCGDGVKEMWRYSSIGC